MSAKKVAIVTGSGKQRVGNRVVEALAEHGYRVVVHYRTSAQQAADSVQSLTDRKLDAIAVAADLTDETAVARMVQDVFDRFGRIDALINCAAVWRSKCLEETTSEDVRFHFETNALGTFLCAKYVGMLMVKQTEGGCIVNVGDWADARPYRDHVAYFLSKGAIPALTRTLAVELGTRNPRIRVNCLLPGPVMLPADMDEQERRQVIAATLVQREGSPDNIAQAVLFFLENDFVTGVCLPVDGGRTVFAG